jgi:hypothetical protein
MIEPALTPEQWADMQKGRTGPLREPTGSRPGFVTAHASGKPAGKHGTAALLLYRQPFGFTHEDVLMLQEHAEEMHRAISAGSDGEMLSEAGVEMEQLAERIAALLPPREAA